MNCVLVSIQCDLGYKTCCCFFQFLQMRSQLAVGTSLLLQPEIGQVSLKSEADMEKPSHNRTAGSPRMWPPKAQLCSWDCVSLHKKLLWNKKTLLAWHHLTWEEAATSWEANPEPAPRHVPACFLIWKQQWSVAWGHTCGVITEKYCGAVEIV